MHGSGSLQSQKLISDMPPVQQRRNEVRWRPGQEASFAPPCSSLRSFESKYTALKKALVILLGFSAPPAVAVIRRPHSDSTAGELCPLPPLVTTLQCSPWFWSRFAWYQGLNEVWWGPGQEANLAPPYLNQRSCRHLFLLFSCLT